MPAQVLKFQKTYKMKLGDAIETLNRLHAKITGGIISPDERTEHALILEALNEQTINIGFDCDQDGLPDTVEIFKKTAKTSCCRIMRTKPGRRKSSRKTRG
jgi:hypothetical protein